MTWRLIEADCIEAMRQMEDSSVDAIVTDPPYGLEFMGKEWDRLGPVERQNDAGGGDRRAVVDPDEWMYGGEANPYSRSRVRWQHGAAGPVQMQAWHHAWATEALRVLKPGGHLLAFGGTRTYHRLACAVEDAGFDIRDCLAWLYGSGFPKSLDVSKAIDKQRDDREAKWAVADWLRPHVERIGFDVVTEAFGFGDETMARARWTSRSQTNTPTWDQWLRLKELCGFGDEMDAEVWRLNGRKGTPGEAWSQREVIGSQRGTHNAHGSGLGGAAVGIPQVGIDVPTTVPALDTAQAWQGWGTALKPAFEPIVMARKPLVGTVAANVLEHGTGALNIDGTRIEADYENEPGRGPGWLGSGQQHKTDDTWQGPAEKADGSTVADRVNTAGRWPANVVLDEAAAALLDEQTGERPSAGRYIDPVAATAGREAKHPSGVSLPALPRDNAYANDTGGASRFFYVAKSASAERNRGLEHRTDRSVPNNAVSRADQDNEHARRPNRAAVANTHPTVKPVELMQWLCRLVTPPGGVVLDPFTGSGSTGIAALREGFSFIGIEREAEYVEIARDRIIGDAPLFNVSTEAT